MIAGNKQIKESQHCNSQRELLHLHCSFDLGYRAINDNNKDYKTRWRNNLREHFKVKACQTKEQRSLEDSARDLIG